MLIFVSVALTFMAYKEYQLRALPNIHFHKLETYFVNVVGDAYNLRAVVNILNKDATKAFVVEAVSYNGGMNIGNVRLIYFKYNSRFQSKAIEGKYYLPPGTDISIKITFENTERIGPLEEGGPFEPSLVYTGQWTFLIDGHEFDLEPREIVTKVISQQEWDNL